MCVQANTVEQVGRGNLGVGMCLPGTGTHGVVVCVCVFLSTPGKEKEGKNCLLVVWSYLNLYLLTPVTSREGTGKHEAIRTAQIKVDIAY